MSENGNKFYWKKYCINLELLKIFIFGFVLYCSYRYKFLSSWILEKLKVSQKLGRNTEEPKAIFSLEINIATGLLSSQKKKMTQCKLQLIFTRTVALGSMATSGFIVDALIWQSKIFTWILGRWEEKVMYFQQEFLPFISMSNVGVTNLKKTTKPWWQKLIILITFCTLILLERIWHLINFKTYWS